MGTIVITGSSTGIGRATAIEFSRRGWDVAATMRHPESCTEFDGYDNIRLFTLDVTDSTSIDAAANAIQAEYDTIDCLFNNAGYCLFGPLELSSEEQIRTAYDTLLVGVTLVTRRFIPLLRANGKGTIITTSSVGGVLTLPLTPTYHAAKYAVEGLMEGLSYELAPFKILCKIIEPGGVQTDFWSRSLMMADGIAGSPYDHEATRYLEAMTRPVSENRVTPDMVAKTVFAAATDGTVTWRYPVASQEFIALRRSMSDEQWYRQQVAQYMGARQ